VEEAARETRVTVAAREVMAASTKKINLVMT